MTREEKMKYYWEKIQLRYRLDRDKYFTNDEWGLFHWSYFLLGTSPLLLHSQMFKLAVMKLGSDE